MHDKTPAARPFALISDYAIDWRDPGDSIAAALEQAQAREAELSAQAAELRAHLRALGETRDALYAVFYAEETAEDQAEFQTGAVEAAEAPSAARQQLDVIEVEISAVWTEWDDVTTSLYVIQRDMEWLINVLCAFSKAA
jgi:hypothetical protein